MVDRATVVELRDVSKSYRPSLPRAVGPISFDVRPGELLVIVGPSGCGKTTLLRLIAGLERPDCGEIVLHGKTVTSAKAWVPPEDRNVGMVFQDYSLFPHLTVRQNVSFGLNPRDAAQIRYAEELFQLMGLSDLLERYPHQLSGGEQQRVAVARALAHKPDVILFDEPFSNLDANLRPRMRRELKKVLRRLGSTSLFVTHDQVEALELADRVAVLRRGQLEQVDTAENIYHFPATRFVAEFVGDADFIRGTVRNGLLVTELGELNLSSPLGVEPLSRGAGAMQVDVMIRPQDIELTPNAGDRDSSAQVVLRQFRGSEIIYTVRLPNGAELRAEQASDSVCVEGARVEIRLKSPPALFHEGKRIG